MPDRPCSVGHTASHSFRELITFQIVIKMYSRMDSAAAAPGPPHSNTREQH